MVLSFLQCPLVVVKTVFLTEWLFFLIMKFFYTRLNSGVVLLLQVNIALLSRKIFFHFLFSIFVSPI